MLNASLGTAGTFWVYAGVCALGFFGVKRWLPETKGKKLEEIDGFWTKLAYGPIWVAAKHSRATCVSSNDCCQRSDSSSPWNVRA